MQKSGSVSRKARVTGRVLSGIVIAFLLFDSMTKLLLVNEVVTASAKSGYPIGLLQPIGAILMGCLVLYLIPRTSVLGAILLTGYLGGAVEANLRVGAPLLSTALFPVYFGILAWAGVYLRDRRLRDLLPFRRRERRQTDAVTEIRSAA
jgi:ABC-type transport system involved in cytochrome c biogenesis permease component